MRLSINLFGDPFLRRSGLSRLSSDFFGDPLPRRSGLSRLSSDPLPRRSGLLRLSSDFFGDPLPRRSGLTRLSSDFFGDLVLKGSVKWLGGGSCWWVRFSTDHCLCSICYRYVS